MESRFHIGPNICLFFNPWENAPCFGLYYVNPNRAKAVDLEPFLDIAPIKGEAEKEELFRVCQASGSRSEEDNLIQQVIRRAYEDSRSPEIKKVEEHVASPEALESMLHLMIKNTKLLPRKLKRLGVEIRPAGKHQYKAKNCFVD